MAATQMKNLSSLENTPRNVQVKVDFVRVGEIDTMNDKFTAEVLIETKWSDFDQSIDTYDPQKHWNPKLYIQNVLNEPKEVVKYEFEKEANCLKITEIKTVKGQFWERLELYNFPFDLQELNIVLTTKLDSSQINLVADTDNFTFLNNDARRTFIDQQKWKLFEILQIRRDIPNGSRPDDIEKKTDEVNIEIDPTNAKKKKKTPKLVVTAFARRHPEFYLFNALFLIFLITASSLTVFSIPISLPANRLQVTYTILLSSISFKWVINRSLPPVSYLTLLDKYSIVCILYINVLAAYHSVAGSFHTKLPSSLDFWSVICAAAGFGVIHVGAYIWYVVVTKKSRKLRSEQKRFIKEYNGKNNKNRLLRDEDAEDEE